MSDEKWTIESLITKNSVFSQSDMLTDAAARIFELIQFLLDDENNLTKIGNLNINAKKELRSRIEEIFMTDVLENVNNDIEEGGEIQ